MLRDASSNPTFWVLAGTFFICGLSTNGLIQSHFISLCADYGMPAVEAASTLAMMGMFDLVGTIGSGWLSDRYDSRALLCWYYGLRGLSLLFLPYSTFTLYGLSLFAAFYGLDWIATVPPTVRLAAQNFGRERSGVVFGWIFASHQIGAAVAAFGARPVAQRAQQLSSRVLFRRLHVPRRGGHRLADPPAAGRGRARGGLIGLDHALLPA